MKRAIGLCGRNAEHLVSFISLLSVGGAATAGFYKRGEPGPLRAPPAPVENQFTFIVLCGMTLALVIETPDWYSGLLQAAVARVHLDSQVTVVPCAPSSDATSEPRD
jgi:hypothetical protein